jgi:hypothetical protein
VGWEDSARTASLAGLHMQQSSAACRDSKRATATTLFAELSFRVVTALPAPRVRHLRIDH